MPLKISLKPGERMFVGGAVISNSSSHKCDLLVSNDAPVLREKDILGEKEATTPCSRIYFTVQLMYIDHENQKVHADAYWHQVEDLLSAAPSWTGLIDRISENIVNERYYQALKLAGDLIEYEREVLRNVR
ncbi:MAG: flagellar biosynthesis repressor FlbT [Desulfobacterales bacterium]